MSKNIKLSLLSLSGTALVILALIFASIFTDLNGLRSNQDFLRVEAIDTYMDLQNVKNEYHVQISNISSELDEAQNAIDILEGRIDLLDSAVNLAPKRQAKIDLAVVAIKESLPSRDNPHKGCRAKPTQGETRRIAEAVIKFSEKHGVPSSLVLAIIRQESIFCNAAISHRGARGYMQLMPDTAVEIANDVGAPLKPWRSRDNIHMGTVYIGTLLTQFDGDVDLAIRAYNGGPGHVQRVLDGRTRERTCEDGRITRYYCETDKYAEFVHKYMERYKKLGL